MLIHATARPVSGRRCGRNHTNSGNPAVGTWVSGPPPPLPGPVRRFGSEPFAAPTGRGPPGNGGRTIRPGHRAHCNRNAATHVTPHRDTHPQLLWATLLICRQERPQRTERTHFPSHCTTYVHFPYAPIFITIQIVNRINGLPAASICPRHRRHTPPGKGIPIARSRGRDTHGPPGARTDRIGKGFARPSGHGRPGARDSPGGTEFDGIPIAPAQSDGIPNRLGQAPETGKTRRRHHYRTSAPCGSAPASMASISASDKPK